MSNDGYRVVAVSDSRGAIYKEDGFDVPSLIYQKNTSRQLKAVYCDGSVHSIRYHIVPDLFESLGDKSDGESIDHNKL